MKNKKELIKNIVTWIISAIIGAAAATGILVIDDDGTIMADKDQIINTVTDKIVKE